MAASLLTRKLVKNHAAPSQVVPCMTATEAERGCAAAQAKKCLVLPAQAKGGRSFPCWLKADKTARRLSVFSIFSREAAVLYVGAPMADGDGGVYLPQNTEIKVGSTPTAHTRKNKTKEVNFMLYSEAIELLEDMADDRFTPITEAEREKVRTAIRLVAKMATVRACPKRALHAAIRWIVENWEAKEA